MVDQVTHHVSVSHVQGHTFLYAVGAGASGQVYDAADQTPAASAGRPAGQGPARAAQAALPAGSRRPARPCWAGRRWWSRRRRRTARSPPSSGSTTPPRWSCAGNLRQSAERLQRGLLRVADGQRRRPRPRRQAAAGRCSRPAPEPTTRAVAGPRLVGRRPRCRVGSPLFDAREVGSGLDGGAAPVLLRRHLDGLGLRAARPAGLRCALPAGWTRVTMPSGRHVVQASGEPYALPGRRTTSCSP